MASRKRRGHGEGSVAQRTDGRWMGRITLADGSRKAVYAATQKEVIEKMDDAKAKDKRGESLAVQRMKLGDYLDEWLDNTAAIELKVSTLQDYKAIVRLHIKPTIGNVQLGKLTREHIKRLIAEKAPKLSSSRVHAIHAVLSAALSAAEDDNLIPRNVARGIPLPARPDSHAEPFTLEQSRAVLAALSKHRLSALYTLDMTTGCRQGEILALKWEDIDLDNGQMRVFHSLDRIDKKLVRVETKNKKSRRTVKLGKAAIEALRTHKTRQVAERLKAGPMWANSGYVFTNETGGPLDGSNVTHQFQRILKNAKLPHRRFHDLRHTYASILFAQGIPLKTISELLGHSSVAITSQVYIHLFPEAGTTAADKMDAALAAV